MGERVWMCNRIVVVGGGSGSGREEGSSDVMFGDSLPIAGGLGKRRWENH